MRGKGIAVGLCAEAIHAARERGVRELYLLTATAPGFFEKLGFVRLARAAAPEAIRQTREFRELCPDSSVVMRKELDVAAARAAVTHVMDVYQRFLRGEPAPLVEFLAPAAVYHLPGHHLGGGWLNGREAILARMVSALRACDVAPTVRVLGARGDPSAVVTTEQYAARRGSSRLDQQVRVVWRLEQGRCVELWAHFEDQDACDAFWEGWSAQRRGRATNAEPA
jgi:ketosteroid isomerase-like protein